MRVDPRRAAPTAVAALAGLAYVLVAPKSVDLAAQLLRVKLFGAEGFGLWNNWWYGGHYVVGYSVVFPALGWLLTPQLIAAIAVVAAAAGFEALAHERFGDDAWLGALWFGAAVVTILLSGRLTFAVGLAPAIFTALALQRRRPGLALAAALLTALASPVAALFAALAAVAYTVGTRRPAGVAVAVAALLPVLALSAAFPEGGTEPFAFSALWPVVVVAGALVPLTGDRTLRAGIALYALGCVAAFVIPTPVGGNAVRLGTLVAGPLAGLLIDRRRAALLAVAALPLIYLQWQDAVRDLVTARQPGATTAYYRPLLGFLTAQSGEPFRIEIPFTATHWEAYEVAPRFPLARGWERQLDRRDNALFYAASLSSVHYAAWLHRLAVRFVALPDAGLDYSARREAAVIRSDPPYLHLVFRSAHWRVYAVADATPLASGVATVRQLGPNSVTLRASRPGTALVRVRYSPYWALSGAAGCVEPAGDFTAVDFHRAGPARLVIEFSLGRIGARSPRCN